MPSSLFEQDLPRAELSDDGVYRYLLRRRFGIGGRHILWVGLNPSTADAEQDDPTTRRISGYTSLWGEPAFELVNLYAFRATDPKALLEVEDPTGSDNDFWIVQAAKGAKFAVCCWGSPVFTAFERRAARVVDLLLAAGCSDIRCLKLTSDGHPGHPLYLPATLNPIPWGLEPRA